MPSRRPHVLILIPVAVTVLAVTTAVLRPGEPSGPVYGVPSAAATARLEARARDVVEAWRRREPEPRRTFVPVAQRGSPGHGWTVRLGHDPDPSRDREIARAVDDRRLRRPARLTRAPSEGLPDGSRGGRRPVRWDDGAVADVPVVPASEALATVLGETCRIGTCDAPEVAVTGARLGALRVRTAHGWAAAPAWIFALEGTPVRVAHVAADPATEPPPVGPRFQGGGAVPVTAGEARGAGPLMTVRFVGSRPGTGPCASEFRARAVEGRSAVVVIVQSLPRRRPDRDVQCAPAGTPRRLDVRLSAPLGERVLLGLGAGEPVPVARTM